jgi:hypothetical protein
MWHSSDWPQKASVLSVHWHTFFTVLGADCEASAEGCEFPSLSDSSVATALRLLESLTFYSRVEVSVKERIVSGISVHPFR